MATSAGPDISLDGLVFGYDNGYPASDNTQALRFNNGEPTTNLVTNPDFSTGDLTGWSSTSTSNSQVDITEVSIENGYYYFHKKCTSTGAGSHDRLYQSSTYTLDTSLKTTITIDIWINPSNAYTLSFYGLGSTADDTTYNEKPLSSNSSDVTTIDLGGGWTRYIYTLQTAWYTGSGTSFRVAVYPGWSGTGLLEYKVKSLQVEQKGHATPFVNGTRSSTQSLIDLKETTDIDVDDASFDSNAQMTFDGTDDVISTSHYSGRNPSNSPFSIEAIVKSTTTSGNHMWLDVNGNGSNQRFYCAHASDGSSTPMGIQNSGWSHSIPQDTNYHHYVITMDGSTATLYNNGTSHSSKSYTSYTLPNNIQAGGRSGYRWLGHIPIFKIYEKVLTTDEIALNYNAYKNRFGI